MISGAGIAPAPAVAPFATAPSFSCSTSSGAIHCKPEVGRPYRCSGNLLEKRRFTAEGTDDGQLQSLAEQLAGNPSHVVGGHRVDLRHGVVDILDFSRERLLTAVPRRDRVGALHLQQQPALVELFGLRQLSGFDRLVTEAAQLPAARTAR